MSKDTRTTQAGRQYAAAHAAHYATQDLTEAIGLYRRVMAAYADTQEAAYSRAQIYNIVKSVVPDLEVLDAETEMTLAHLGHDGPSEGDPATLTPLAAELAS